MTKMRVISCFSGAGISDSLLHESCEVVAFLEEDKVALEICRRELQPLHPRALFIQGTADSLATLNVLNSFRGTIHGLVASPPCQDVSCARGKRVPDGQRTGLWRTLPSLATFLFCDFVVIENVAGMRSAIKDGDEILERPTLGLMADVFLAMGWALAWRTVNPICFGDPNCRARVYVVASASFHPATMIFRKSDVVSRRDEPKLLEALAPSGVSEDNPPWLVQEGSRPDALASTRLHGVTTTSQFFLRVPLSPSPSRESLGHTSRQNASWFKMTVEDLETVFGVRRGYTAGTLPGGRKISLTKRRLMLGNSSSPKSLAFIVGRLLDRRLDDPFGGVMKSTKIGALQDITSFPSNGFSRGRTMFWLPDVSTWVRKPKRKERVYLETLAPLDPKEQCDLSTSLKLEKVYSQRPFIPCDREERVRDYVPIGAAAEVEKSPAFYCLKCQTWHFRGINTAERTWYRHKAKPINQSEEAKPSNESEEAKESESEESEESE